MVALLLTAPLIDQRRREEANANMMMLLVVPSEEALAPRASFLETGKALRIRRPVLQRFELRLRVGIVVGDAGTRMTSGDIQVDEELIEGLGGHRRAVIGMNGKRRRINAPLSNDGRKELLSKRAVFIGFETPADDETAKNVDSHIEMEPNPFLSTGQLRDIPGEYLIWCRRNQLRLDASRMGRNSTSFSGFSKITKDPIHRGNRTKVDSFIEQGSIDFPYA